MLCGSCYVSDLKETIQTHLQSRETRRLRGRRHGCCGVGEGAVREVGMGVDTLPCLKRVSSEDALHRALCRVVCGGWRGRSLGGMDACARVADALPCAPRTVTTL